jgi:hypothetical protein
MPSSGVMLKSPKRLQSFINDLLEILVLFADPLRRLNETCLAPAQLPTVFGMLDFRQTGHRPFEPKVSPVTKCRVNGGLPGTFENTPNTCRSPNVLALFSPFASSALGLAG